MVGIWCSGNLVVQLLLGLVGGQVEKGKIVAAAAGSRTGYAGADLKTGTLDWPVPVTVDKRRGWFVIPPLVSDGVMYVVKDSKRLAGPLERK